MKTYFITGIGTDVGKTVVSAIVSQALNATYWKPIQSGTIDTYDRYFIEEFCSDKVTTIPEWIELKAPLSPHAAAKLENITIDVTQLHLPKIDNHLVIEGAGGIMVPITDDFSFLDLMNRWKIPVIVVSKHYLGSINHTLLTLEVLKVNKIPLQGVIFVGEENKETEQVISAHCDGKILGRIPWTSTITKEWIQEQAAILEINIA